MERGSSKHNPRLDEHQKQETEGLVRGGGTSHAEEWKQPEPMPAPGEESPTRYAPQHAPGTPEGIDAEGVNFRSELAKWLNDAIFPASAQDLVRHAERPEVPDLIADAVRSLPEGRYANVAEVAEAIGIGVERRRW